MSAQQSDALEIFRLSNVRDTLMGDLKQSLIRERQQSAQAQLSMKQCSLLGKQKRLWPIRLFWNLPPRGFRGDLLRPFSSWGISQWYGSIRMFRFGPLILEIGRDDVLNAKATELHQLYKRLVEDSEMHADGTVARSVESALRRIPDFSDLS